MLDGFIMIWINEIDSVPNKYRHIDAIGAQLQLGSSSTALEHNLKREVFMNIKMTPTSSTMSGVLIMIITATVNSILM